MKRKNDKQRIGAIHRTPPLCFRLGGSLKRSLGLAFPTSTIPKAFGFEAATRWFRTGQ